MSHYDGLQDFNKIGGFGWSGLHVYEATARRELMYSPHPMARYPLQR
jgi:hypothetical protein